MQNKTVIFLVIILVIVVGFLIFRSTQEFPLPEGETAPLEEDLLPEESDDKQQEENSQETENTMKNIQRTNREILVTNGTKRSIPLDEILSGGPGKDGIPSIDEPKFIETNEAPSYIDDESIGIGLGINGDVRFYPFPILVWHEIVNDTVGGTPVAVTYCPLCQTGIVFERMVDGEAQEFGVSGRLWQSNLLMYNRTGDEDTESLWSQVLGEAVVGPATGTQLPIVSSDITRWGEWRDAHPDTKILSDDTGSFRSYGRDPYEGYYTSSDVSFGATFNDDRLHPKTFVYGVEIDGQYKAYPEDEIQGGTTDKFAGKNIAIEETSAGGFRFLSGGDELRVVGGFWFSWIAVHPDTELFTQ